MRFILSYNNSLPEKLRKLRWQRKPYLTQDELAKKLGTNQTEISRIENGHYPSIITFLNYCYFFGISADELLGLCPENEIEYLQP